MNRTDEQYQEMIDAIRRGHEPSRHEVLALVDWAEGKDQDSWLRLEKLQREYRVIGMTIPSLCLDDFDNEVTAEYVVPRVPCSIQHHDALKSNHELWSQMVCLGVQRLEADEGGPAEDYEVRNCTCGSTLYKLIEPTQELNDSDESLGLSRGAL